MKTQQEVLDKIDSLRYAYKHVLTGEIYKNAPRALIKYFPKILFVKRIEAEVKLKALHWVLGRNFRPKLKQS